MVSGRKSRVRFFVFLAVLLFIIGCSTPRTQFIDPEYKNLRLRDPISILIIDYDTFSNVGTEHAFSPSTPYEVQILTENAQAILSQVTYANVLGVLNGYIDPKKIPFKSRFLEINDQALQIMTPAKAKVIEHNGTVPRFVLILDQYFFRQFEQTSEGTVYAGHDRSHTRRGLYFQTSYAIWDNERQELVGWGNTFADQTISGVPGPNDYVMVIHKTFQKIVDLSPFYM